MRKRGFDTFDMADHYGSAELIAGRLLARYPGGRHGRSRFTKWCPEPGPMTADMVRRGVQERLDRLGVAKIDLLQLHWWTFDHPAWLDALHEMNRLREEGLIGAIGVTNFDAAHLALALADGIPLASNQVSFSLIDRRAAGPLSDALRQAGREAARLRHALRRLSVRQMAGPAGAGVRSPTGAAPNTSVSSTRPAAGRLSRRSCRRPPRSPASMASRSRMSRPAGSSDHQSVAAAIIGARITESEHRADNLEAASTLRSTPRTRRGWTAAFAATPPIPGDCGDEYRQAALSHRVGRSQPPSRCHSLGLHGRAGTGPSRPVPRLVRQRLGADRRLQPGGAGRATGSAFPARPRRTAPTAAWPPATPVRRPPTSSTRLRRRSPRWAARWTM